MDIILFVQIIVLMICANTIFAPFKLNITIKHELPTNWDIKMNNTNIHKSE